MTKHKRIDIRVKDLIECIQTIAYIKHVQKYEIQMGTHYTIDKELKEIISTTHDWIYYSGGRDD